MSAPAPIRFAPPIWIDGAAVALANRLARPRQGVSTVIEGLALRLTPVGVRTGLEAAAADDVEIAFGVGAGGEGLALRLPGAVLDRLAGSMQSDLDALPPGPAGALLLEMAFSPLLDAAERITATGLRIEAVTPPAERPGTVLLRFQGTLGDMGFEASLAFPPTGTGHAAQAALALVETLAKEVPSLPALHVPVAALAGHTILTVGQIAAFALGDVVLPDIWHPARGEVLVTLGSSHATPAARDGSRVTTKDTLRPIPAGQTGEEIGMAQDITADTEPGLDAIGVTLAFELGRRTVTLAELKDVGAGHVFDLGLAPDEAVDLVVNGARIGRGEIITVGERIGVRVVRLFGRERSA